MRKLKVVAATVLLVLALSACGDGGDPAVEKANAKAQREFDICQEQADEIARTEGAEAGIEHLDGCSDALWNETQVEE